MASNLTGYGKSPDTDPGPSPAIWGRFPYGSWDVGLSYLNDGRRFVYGMDYAPAAAGTVTSDQNGFRIYVDTTTTAASITSLAGEIGGGIRFTTSATAQHQASIQSGGATGNFTQISASGGDMFFEARVRISSAAIGEQIIFVGLGEEALSANDGFAADDATDVASKDLIGFFTVDSAAAGTAAPFKTMYRKAGSATQVVNATAQTPALTTWYKLGMVYRAYKRELTYYVNAQKAGDSVILDSAGAATIAGVAGTAFPNGEKLAVLVGLKTGVAATKLLDLHWLLCGGMFA